MLVALFMIGGLMNLSAKCNRPDMVKRGHSILTTIVVSYLITLALSILIRFGAYTSSFGAGVINWLSGLSALFTVLALSILIRFGAYTSSFGAGVINWLSGLSALFTVFIYSLELIYLAKAKKMLAEN